MALSKKQRIDTIDAMLMRLLEARSQLERHHQPKNSRIDGLIGSLETLRTKVDRGTIHVNIQAIFRSLNQQVVAIETDVLQVRAQAIGVAAAPNLPEAPKTDVSRVAAEQASLKVSEQLRQIYTGVQALQKNPGKNPDAVQALLAKTGQAYDALAREHKLRKAGLQSPKIQPGSIKKLNDLLERVTALKESLVKEYGAIQKPEGPSSSQPRR